MEECVPTKQVGGENMMRNRTNENFPMNDMFWFEKKKKTIVEKNKTEKVKK